MPSILAAPLIAIALIAVFIFGPCWLCVWADDRAKARTAKPGKPAHTHDCDGCQYLGTIVDTQGRTVDNWRHYHGDTVEHVARFGPGSDYAVWSTVTWAGHHARTNRALDAA